MKIWLRHRRYGIHSFIKEAEIPGSFEEFAKLKESTRDEYEINEDKLIASLPKNFLPVEPEEVLLTVEVGNGGTGQRGLNKFLNWAKYFDSYSIALVKEEAPTKQLVSEVV